MNYDPYLGRITQSDEQIEAAKRQQQGNPVPA